MMRTLFSALIICSTLANAVLAQDAFHLPKFRLNPNRSDFVFSHQQTFLSHDQRIETGPAVIESVKEKIVAGEVTNQKKSVIAYDENGYNISAVWQDWNFSSWTTSKLITSERDDAGKVLSATVQEQSYDLDSEEQGDGKYKLMYEYDEYGRVFESYRIKNYPEANNWKRDINTGYSYNAEGRISQKRERYYNWRLFDSILDSALATQGPEVDSTAYRQFIRDLSDSLVVTLYDYSADEVTLTKHVKPSRFGRFTEDEKIIGLYSAGILIEVIRQEWSGSAWENTEKEVHGQNGADKIITNMSWDAANSIWVNNQKLTQSNGANGPILVLQNWTGTQWRNLVKIEYHYGTELFPDLVEEYSWKINGSEFEWLLLTQETFALR